MQTSCPAHPLHHWRHRSARRAQRIRAADPLSPSRPYAPHLFDNTLDKSGELHAGTVSSSGRGRQRTKKRSGETPAPRNTCACLSSACVPAVADVREVVGENVIQESLARHPGAASEPLELVERRFVDPPGAPDASPHTSSLMPPRAGAAARSGVARARTGAGSAAPSRG